MTPDSKKCKETLRQDEVHESTAPPGESLEKKVRIMTEVGAGAPVQSLWRTRSRTSGWTRTARVNCSRAAGEVEADVGLGGSRGGVESLVGQWSCTRHSSSRRCWDETPDHQVGGRLEKAQRRVGEQGEVCRARVQVARVPRRSRGTGSLLLHWTHCRHLLAQA